MSDLLQPDPQIGRSPSSLPSLQSILIEEGRGGRCRDDAGRDYVDYICGYGPVVLGHADPVVTRAVAERLARGTLFPSRSGLLDRLLAALNELYPAVQDAVLLKTGSEAVAAALRLARAHTGRRRILRIGFHGWHDQVVVPYVKWHQYAPTPQRERELDGVPAEAYRDLALVWCGTDYDEVIRCIAEEGAELAAVLVDPVQLPPSPEGMRRLQAAARTAGAVFILDESKTGFRVHLGGVQGLYGLRPDLVVLSKAIANGLPLAVVGGRRDLMRRADAVKIKGTYSNELAAVAAALATIARLREADAPRALAETGTRLLAGLNAVFAAHGVAAQLRAVPFHWPCMPFLHFPDGGQDGLRERFYRELVAAGVLMLPEHMNYVCLAHTEDDLAETFRRVERVLRRIL